MFNFENQTSTHLKFKFSVLKFKWLREIRQFEVWFIFIFCDCFNKINTCTCLLIDCCFVQYISIIIFLKNEKSRRSMSKKPAERILELRGLEKNKFCCDCNARVSNCIIASHMFGCCRCCFEFRFSCSCVLYYLFFLF